MVGKGDEIKWVDEKNLFFNGFGVSVVHYMA
jgi:hypothetical protein